MAIDDLYGRGIAEGWRVIDAASLYTATDYDCDVVIVGSGAGGGTAAEILSAAGLDVIVCEAGRLRSSDSFADMDESRAYAELYQQGAGTTTDDGAIAIFQGRSVGGSTTVNWCTSFRTPPQTLEHWAFDHAVSGLREADLAPWFERMERRLSIAPWGVNANANNAVLADGCRRLGYDHGVIARNVLGCWNLGYCGLGCPANAKQSMLVTTIPQALSAGARLIHGLHVDRIQRKGERATGLTAYATDAAGSLRRNAPVTIRARHVIAAGGAINTPGLLLRSDLPDPYGRLGARTCIHPVNASMAFLDASVDGYHGAPQSAYSDHFQWRDGATGPIGFKLEVAPTYPSLVGSVLGGLGSEALERNRQLRHTNMMIALLRDGFTDDAPGGQVRLRDGRPVLDYPLTAPLWEGLRRALHVMADIQFAGGAREVLVAHTEATPVSTVEAAHAQIDALSMRAHSLALFTAHLMGGCAMGEDQRRAVVDSRGRHHQVEALSVMDGSLFPTSIGANPQLSIYGIVAKLATQLAEDLKSA